MISPNGDAFVMQSSSIPPAELGTLGGRLDPVSGWRLQTRTLAEALTVPMDGKVKVAMDDLRNVYNIETDSRNERD